MCKRQGRGVVASVAPTNTPPRTLRKPAKSLALIIAHASAWRALAARYAARRMAAAAAENDAARRDAALAEIDRQEDAERTALLARQQNETEADLATQFLHDNPVSAEARSLLPIRGQGVALP
jgi:hypothetical protein